MIDVLLGLQWGDEGKGKIIDFLAKKYQVVARFQGGPNAGHTLYVNGKKVVLHTIPSGIFHPHLLNLIGNGVVIDPITLRREIENLHSLGVPTDGSRLVIARKAHLILPTHRLLDAASEASKGKQKIGSTLRGIGPTYMDKTGRNGLRIGDVFLPDFQERYQALRQKHLNLAGIYTEVDFDLEAEEAKWFEAIEFLKNLTFVDGEYWIHNAITSGKNILAEGAQGSMLDVDFGTYPFVTSSNTITAGVCSGLGVAPQHIREVIGVTKAYCTRVGSGPFPSELNDETGEKLRQAGGEFGATTGRPRRCGWIDVPQLKYTIMLNGVTQLVVTKIDVLDSFDSISIGTHYVVDGEKTDLMPYDICTNTPQVVFEKYEGWNTLLTECTTLQSLPEKAVNYIDILEKWIGTPIKYVSVGPGRDQLIVR